MEIIISKFLKGTVKTIQTAPTICNCSHCKKEIDSNYTYLRFTGEHLHKDCLIEYLQRMRLLEVITSQESSEK